MLPLAYAVFAIHAELPVLLDYFDATAAIPTDILRRC